MKLNNKRTLTLNKEEATILINAADLMETILHLSDDEFSLTEPMSETKFSSEQLWDCYSTLNDFIFNYGSDGKDTIKYKMEIEDEN